MTSKPIRPRSSSTGSKCSFVGQGIYELYCLQAEAAEQRRKPQLIKTVYARGSMEWLAEQKKSG
jgi:hypothetical protein